MLPTHELYKRLPIDNYQINKDPTTNTFHNNKVVINWFKRLHIKSLYTRFLNAY